MVSGMPRPRPPHLHHERNRHGTLVWYVRVGKGPRIRIKAAYGTPEFDAAYRAALAGEAPEPTRRVTAGTLNWLIERYRDSQAWSQLSLATRKQRENILRHVLKQSGDKPYRLVSKKATKQGWIV